MNSHDSPFNAGAAEVINTLGKERMLPMPVENAV